jgi:hypothetical protein
MTARLRDKIPTTPAQLRRSANVLQLEVFSMNGGLSDGGVQKVCPQLTTSRRALADPAWGFALCCRSLFVC